MNKIDWSKYDITDKVGDVVGSPDYQSTDKTMPSTFKEHLISAGVTFGSTFLTVFSLEIVNTSFSFSREALLSLSLAAVVAGVRSVAKLFLEWKLGRKL